MQYVMIYISKRHIYLRVDESYYFLYAINQLRALPTGSALLRINWPRLYINPYVSRIWSLVWQLVKWKKVYRPSVDGVGGIGRLCLIIKDEAWIWITNIMLLRVLRSMAHPDNIFHPLMKRSKTCWYGTMIKAFLW